jgi:hypothetical protein
LGKIIICANRVWAQGVSCAEANNFAGGSTHRHGLEASLNDETRRSVPEGAPPRAERRSPARMSSFLGPVRSAVERGN